MPIYTFYPHRPDGAALTFEAVDLSSDGAAAERAQLMLAKHASASSVEVWRDEELVIAVSRSYGSQPGSHAEASARGASATGPSVELQEAG